MTNPHIHCVHSPAFPPDYDMVDSTDELVHLEPLDAALIYCNQILTPLYITYDRSAIVGQKNHTAVTKLFIASGTIAVIGTTILLVNKSLDVPDIFNWPGITIEVLASIFALIAVISGIISSFHRQWLLDRHKAERIRLLKFRYLIDPRIWEGKESSTREANEDLALALKEIDQIGYQHINPWLVDISVPEPAQGSLGLCGKETVMKFVEYYRKKRVEYQKYYYCKKINQLLNLDQKTGRIPILFFFMGVIAVLGHFLIDLFSAGIMYLGILSVVLAGLAITLPFLGVAVRSLRLSSEVSRGVILFKAKYTALSSLDMRLEALAGKADINCDGIFKTIWECEDFLEAEHREWLLLVENAEYLM